MEKSKEELQKELADLKRKYQTLEEKHKKETGRLRQTEEDLLLRLLFLEGIANSAVDGFLVVNPIGQKVFQNRRTIELWKIPQEVADDPQGVKQVDHVKNMAVDPKQFLADIVYLGEHPNEKSRDELELVDGTILDRYSAPVIGKDGKNYGRIWTFHDVTERKKIENQLIQLNTDKDRFISILAHDLRTPIANIWNLIELLKDNLESYSVEKLKEFVNHLFDTATKARNMLEDTLVWANQRSGNLAFNPETYLAVDVVSDVIDVLLPGANLKNICIVNNVNKDLLVFADLYMLKAILRNLVSNAVKFTNSDGRIEIEAIKTKDYLKITVRDNGVGISDNVLNKLFQISTMVSTKGTAKEKGSGLGLLLCKEFVEKHNGEIWIESEINKGTTAIFTIPFEEK